MSIPETAIPNVPEVSQKPTFADELRKHIASKYSLINIVTFEDYRCAKTVSDLCMGNCSLWWTERP